MQPKIVFFEVEAWEDNILKEKLPTTNIIFKETKLDLEKDADTLDAEIISVFTFSQLTKEVLEKFTKLKMIVTRSTGYDHIDINYCKEKGIVVTNVPAYGVHTIAEHTFSLLLALTRKIVPSVERTRKGDFSLDGLQGIELYQKTLGVIGAGHIGSVVIDIAKGFGMNILVYSRHPEEKQSDELIKYVGMDELLANSDVVTLHVPLTPETRHLINMDNITKFKKGAILINAARGAIVETQAIVDAIEKGIFRGVGLDVLEEECDLREERELLSSEFLAKCDLKTQLLNHILLNSENVIVTPHNAFNSHEAVMTILHTTVDNINAYIAGNPQNVVSK